MELAQRMGVAFTTQHPDDAARLMERLPPTDTASFLAILAPADVTGVLSQMSSTRAGGCLAAMDQAQAARIVSALPATVAARVLRQMKDPQPLLSTLPRDLADAVTRLLRFPEGTAGALADPSVLTLPEDLSVADALKLLRQAPERVFSYLYVLDRGDRLVGVLDLGELMSSSGPATLNAIMRRGPVAVRGHTDLHTVAADPAWLEFDALPVVDGSGSFLGVIRHRALRRLMEQVRTGVSGFSPLINLAELYWNGFSKVLFGFEGTIGHREATDGQ